MLRGLIGGIFFGGIVGGLGLVAATLGLERRDLALPTPEAEAVAVPAGSEFNAARPDDAPVLPQTEGRPAGTAAPLVTQADNGADPLPDTNPAATPETGRAEDTLDAPAAGAAAEISVAGEDDSPNTGAVVLPNQPGLDASPNGLAPVAPIQTEGDLDEDLATPAPEPAPEVVAPEADSDVVVDSGVAPVQPEAEGLPAAEDPATVPNTGPTPDVIAAPDAPLETVPPSLPDASQGFGVAAVPDIGPFAPQVETDGLPRIGAGPEAPSTVVQDPALQRYAVPFEAVGDNPLMSLILIDDPAVDAASLANFPVPLTLSVDPLQPNAGARMADLRAVGLELVVATPLPVGATPADVEIAFQGFLDAVPQSVAVMDLPEGLLQENRPRAAQVIQILAETGHGMVTYERGLNAAIQLAEREEVKAATVFRVFDDGEKDGAAIKRFLDQGAFRAGQVGPVILVGQARPETLLAITEWTLGNRASTVTLAPISAVLKVQ